MVKSCHKNHAHDTHHAVLNVVATIVVYCKQNNLTDQQLPAAEGSHHRHTNTNTNGAEQHKRGSFKEERTTTRNDKEGTVGRKEGGLGMSWIHYRTCSTNQARAVLSWLTKSEYVCEWIR